MRDQASDNLIIETETIEAETPRPGPVRGLALTMVLASIVWCAAGFCFCFFVWRWL